MAVYPQDCLKPAGDSHSIPTDEVLGRFGLGDSAEGLDALNCSSFADYDPQVSEVQVNG